MPKPKELTSQARYARSLAISVRSIGTTELGGKQGVKNVLGGARVQLKAAKKGVHLTELAGAARHTKSLQSHRSPLKHLEQKVRKLARKFDPIAKKTLPKGPRTILGGFAIPGIVRKMTERVQAIESKGRRKRHQAGGYTPRGGGEA